jgi:translation initiation factor 1
VSERKKGKLEVPEAGTGPALKHNPFAALTTPTAVPAGGNAPSVDPTASAQPAVAREQPAPEQRARSRGRLVLRREKKGRGGKTVVVVAGLRADARLPETEIAELAQLLKQQLGCGGSVERVPSDTVIVVQGDQPARVAELLRAQGFRVDGVTA